MSPLLLIIQVTVGLCVLPHNKRKKHALPIQAPEGNRRGQTSIHQDPIRVPLRENHIHSGILGTKILQRAAQKIILSQILCLVETTLLKINSLSKEYFLDLSKNFLK